MQTPRDCPESQQNILLCDVLRQVCTVPTLQGLIKVGYRYGTGILNAPFVVIVHLFRQGVENICAALGRYR